MSSIAPPAHTRGSHTTDDWISPQMFAARLGPFGLDPCESNTQPWPMATMGYRLGRGEDGLVLPWFGMVWLNPPYGKATGDWLAKLARHGEGIALVFARTETRMFFDHVWGKASAMLFLRGRLTFHYPDGAGSPAGHNSGGPSVLIGYGLESHDRLQRNRNLGAFLSLLEEKT